MISYTYLKDLFQSVFDTSRAIQGRFHVSYRYGAQEINHDQLGEIIKEIKDAKKYPLAIMLAPRSQVMPSNRMGEWETYRITIFFVKTMFYDGDNNISMQNPKTKTSMHDVLYDWHDMKRCAINFGRRLDKIVREPGEKFFRLPKTEARIIPVSGVGSDRTSGVRYDFDFELWLGCELEDYDEYLPEFQIQDDSHPEHKL